MPTHTDQHALDKSRGASRDLDSNMVEFNGCLDSIIISNEQLWYELYRRVSEREKESSLVQQLATAAIKSFLLDSA